MVSQPPRSPPAGATNEPVPGTVFEGRYRLERELGRGTMGVVFQATQLNMGRPVALKILASTARQDSRMAKRFKREAEICSRLEHPNTIRLLDFGRAETGHLYIAMELLRGRTLSDAGAEGVFSVADTIHIGRQIGKSLAEAHAQGIVHRDLKPENIFLKQVYGEPLFVKVLDFGIARVYDDPSAEALTQSGFVVGTIRYMSPEQARGEHLDGRSDLYTLGCILSELLTGQPVYAGLDAASRLRLIASGPTPHVPPVSSDDPRCARLIQLLKACRAGKREQRPADAEVFLAELAALDAVAQPGVALPGPTVMVPAEPVGPAALAPHPAGTRQTPMGVTAPPKPAGVAAPIPALPSPQGSPPSVIVSSDMDVARLPPTQAMSLADMRRPATPDRDRTALVARARTPDQARQAAAPRARTPEQARQAAAPTRIGRRAAPQPTQAPPVSPPPVRRDRHAAASSTEASPAALTAGLVVSPSGFDDEPHDPTIARPGFQGSAVARDGGSPEEVAAFPWRPVAVGVLALAVVAIIAGLFLNRAEPGALSAARTAAILESERRHAEDVRDQQVAEERSRTLRERRRARRAVAKLKALRASTRGGEAPKRAHSKNEPAVLTPRHAGPRHATATPRRLTPIVALRRPRRPLSLRSAPVVYRVHVSTRPSGAIARQDGRVVGETPFFVEWSSTEVPPRLHIKKRGYRSQSISLSWSSPQELAVTLKKAAARTTRPGGYYPLPE